MRFDVNALVWTRQPADFSISDDKIEIITAPRTDLWQRTYYHFRNDNAPGLQMETDEKFSSFKATFANMELTACQWQAHTGQQPD